MSAPNHLARYGHEPEVNKYGRCLVCYRAACRRRYKEDPEHYLGFGRRFREKDKGHSRKQVREAMRRWRQRHPELNRQRNRETQNRNRDRIRASARRRARENPARQRDSTRRYRERHPERARENARRSAVLFRERYPERAYAGQMEWRARKRKVTVERVLRSVVYQRDGGCCYICGKDVPVKGWHLDHKTPLCRGGEHTYRNVGVTCPTCNVRKRHRTEEEYRAVLARRSAA